MKPKTRVAVKGLPEPVEWILKNATGQQLDFLYKISTDPDFKSFVRLVGMFKDYNVYEVFNATVRDEKELLALRASKRGEVAGLDALIYACQMAREEILRRKNIK